MKYERYIPKGSVKVAPKSGGVVFYLYENASRAPAAVCYIGRAVKPTWHFNFGSEKSREKRIIATIAGVEAHAKIQAERKAERSKPHSWEVGLILKGSWGYEQTNVDFFEVIRVAGPHMVEIQKVGSQRATDASDGGSSMSSHVVPDLEHRGSKHMVKVSRGSCNSPVHGSLSPWSGKPAYESWYG